MSSTAYNRIPMSNAERCACKPARINIQSFCRRAGVLWVNAGGEKCDGSVPNRHQFYVGDPPASHVAPIGITPMDTMGQWYSALAAAVPCIHCARVRERVSPVIAKVHWNESSRLSNQPTIALKESWSVANSLGHPATEIQGIHIRTFAGFNGEVGRHDSTFVMGDLHLTSLGRLRARNFKIHSLSLPLYSLHTGGFDWDRVKHNADVFRQTSTKLFLASGTICWQFRAREICLNFPNGLEVPSPPELPPGYRPQQDCIKLKFYSLDGFSWA
ncbi:hypothetical protein B0H16DRAFT_1472546 [Mycena metata]|uniref:Uncharacterized protein n=1 Tax=Mycena metata TaxID=1033252 RepID=A0AAD7HMQ8_9AGAR|nr:hypothetical protein B0H16DRAFT_1472546 [Mycena metata]